jgi:hypothetical protein
LLQGEQRFAPTEMCLGRGHLRKSYILHQGEQRFAPTKSAHLHG